jgi:hypothetical protein
VKHDSTTLIAERYDRFADSAGSPDYVFRSQARAAIDFEATCVFIAARLQGNKHASRNIDRSCSNATQQLQLCRTQVLGEPFSTYSPV